MGNVKELKINDNIKAQQVRLIDLEGNDLGVMSLDKALDIASEAGTDLIEVSPNEDISVCKLGDFGKLAYKEQKRKAKTKVKTSSLKEMQLTPNIGDHDLELKARKIREFLLDGDKVKVNMRFRGREGEHMDVSQGKFTYILKSVEDIAKLESSSRIEGRQLINILVPIGKVS